MVRRPRSPPLGPGFINAHGTRAGPLLDPGWAPIGPGMMVPHALSHSENYDHVMLHTIRWFTLSPPQWKLLFLYF